jgi:hypothetical protein
MDYGGTKHTGVPVKTLKKLLKKAGLKVSGKKATLTRRAKKAKLYGGNWPSLPEFVRKSLPTTTPIANLNIQTQKEADEAAAAATTKNLRPEPPKSKLSVLPEYISPQQQQEKAKRFAEEEAKPPAEKAAAREKRVKELAERIYKVAIADIPTKPKPGEQAYKLSMNLKEFIKKHDLLIPEPQTKNEIDETMYVRAKSELADAFNYMLDTTDYFSKEDLQNQANSSAYWIAKNKREGYTGEKSNFYLALRNIFTGR